MKTEKVNRETATADFERWLEFKKIRDYKRQDHKKHEEEIIELIIDGSIIIDSECNIKFILSHPPISKTGETILTELIFKPRISVQDLNIKLKPVSSGDDDGRILAYIAALTNQNTGIIEKLDSTDNGVCSSIVVYFL